MCTSLTLASGPCLSWTAAGTGRSSLLVGRGPLPRTGLPAAPPALVSELGRVRAPGLLALARAARLHELVVLRSPSTRHGVPPCAAGAGRRRWPHRASMPRRAQRAAPRSPYSTCACDARGSLHTKTENKKTKNAAKARHFGSEVLRQNSTNRDKI